MNSNQHRLFWLLLVVLTVTTVIRTQDLPPSFSQYPATLSKSKPRPVNIRSHPKAKKYRSNIRYQYDDGINFAGHYVLVKIGCGAACLLSSLVDTKTGRVFFPNEISAFGLQDWAKDLRIRNDSRLLMMNEYIDGNTIGTHYYLWLGTKFKELKFIAVTK